MSDKAHFTPIPLIIRCPVCKTQHVDRDETTEGSRDWRIYPHVRHLCHHCDNIWQPRDAKGRVFAVPTIGIQRFIPVRIESPYHAHNAALIERNLAYGRAALRDALYRGEAPIASHLLYTQPGVLLDTFSAERELGIQAGLVLLRIERVCVYTDLGISDGMWRGIDGATERNIEVVHRTLGPGWRTSL